MIQVPVDPSIIMYEDEYLQKPSFNIQDEERFNELLNSPDSNIWWPQTQMLNESSTLLTEVSDSPGSFIDCQSTTTQEEREDTFNPQDELFDTTAKQIYHALQDKVSRSHRLDELFKKVIRALDFHMRASFNQFLVDKEVDVHETSEQEMEEVLTRFLNQRFNLIQLDEKDISTAKKVFYSIAIKTRQTKFGNAQSEKIKNLRCDFIEFGTKKSGRVFFATKVGHHIFWPIFSRVFDQILETIGSSQQAKYLIKSFAKFRQQVQYT